MSVNAEISRVELSPEELRTLVAQLMEELSNGLTAKAGTSDLEPAPPLFALPDPDQSLAEDGIPNLGKGPLIRGMVTLILRWQAGGYAWITQDKVTPEQISTFWRDHRQDVEASCDWANRFTNDPLMERTAVAAAHYRFSQVNGRESAEAFLYPIGTSLGLEKHTGQHRLVRKLTEHIELLRTRRTKKKLVNEDIVVVLTELYVKHVKGVKVKRLGWPETWTTPEIPRIR